MFLFILLLFGEFSSSNISLIKAEFIPPHFIHQLPAATLPPLTVTFPNDQRVFVVIAPPVSSDQPLSAYSGAPENQIYSDKGEEIENKIDSPFTWHIILGDLCQLPNLRRPAEREDVFAECMPIDDKLAQTLDRKDLGIWRLRRCPIRTGFVPSAQICLPQEKIRLQHLLCSSKEGNDEENDDEQMEALSGCPPKDPSIIWRTAHRKIALSTCDEEEKGKNGHRKCTMTPAELLEPCAIPTRTTMSRLRRQFQGGQLAACPCPPQRTNCICVEAQTHQPQMYMDCCCVEKRLPPCLCTPIQQPEQIPSPPPPPLPPPPIISSPSQPPQQHFPPHLVEDAGGGGQMVRIEISQQQQQRPSPQWTAAQPQQQQNYQYGGGNPYGRPLGGGNFRGDSLAGTNGPGGPPTSSVNAPQPCPLVESSNSIMHNAAHFQDLCSWMLDPLASDPESRTHFLQCQPAPFHLLCGRWQRMPCAPKTVFDQREQLCIWDSSGVSGQFPGAGNQIGAQPDLGNAGNRIGGQQPGQVGTVGTGGIGTGSGASSFIIPARKVLECTCKCRTGGLPLGPCSPSMQCPTPAVCQTGLLTPQLPCTMCCLYRRNRRRREE